MKIILHGATDNTNFGDVLFAELFYQRLAEKHGKDNVKFFEFGKFGINDYYREILKYDDKMTIKDFLFSKRFVYLSGGYFGESNSTSSQARMLFIRFHVWGMLSRWLKKEIYISGVGGGPISKKWLRKIIVKNMKWAEKITVRDEETKDYYSKYNVENINATSDTALMIDKEYVLENYQPSKEVKTITEIKQNKKLLLIHLDTSNYFDELFSEYVVDGISLFLKDNPNFQLVIFGDGFNDFNFSNTKTSKLLAKYHPVYYKFQTPQDLCCLLNQADLVITPKLHVGIVSSSLEKSVISVPIHQYKTQRFYKQINESERSILLQDVTPEKIFELMEKYKNTPIKIQSELREKAKLNLSIL